MTQSNKASEKEMEIDLQKLLLAWLKRWWVIVICAVLGASIALVYARFFVTPTYRAKATMLVNNYGGASETDTFSESQYKASQTLASGYVTIIKSRMVLNEVAQRLNGEYTVKELGKIVSAEQSSGTPILSIYAVTDDPEASARIANIVSDVAPDVVKELLVGGSAKVLDPAEVPESRYQPSYTKYTAIGGMIGLVASVGYLTLLFLLDVRIKDEDELTEICKYPILGQIPDFALLGAKAGKHGYGYGYGYGYSTGKGSSGKSSSGKGSYTLPNRSDREGDKE